MYIDGIKNDVYRAKECDLESLKNGMGRSIRSLAGFTSTEAGCSNDGPNRIKNVFSDVTASDVIGNDMITTCHVSGSVVKANDVSTDDVSTNDVMDGDAKVSDVGEYDVMAVESSSTHKKDDEDRSLCSLAKNYPHGMGMSSLGTIHNDMLLLSDCKSGEEVKNHRISSGENDNSSLDNEESNDGIIENGNEGTSECVVGSKETMSTLQEIHDDAKYCRCFCGRCQTSNKSLEGSKDKKVGLDEKSTVPELRDGWYETDYDTLLSREEQVNKESEKTMECKDASIVIATAVSGCNMEAEHNVEIRTPLEHEQDNLPEKIKKQISKQNSSLDVRLSDMHKLSFGFHKLATTNCECDNGSSKISPRQDHSTQNPGSSDGDFVKEKAEEKLTPEDEEKHFDLSTKQGMDKLKDFLANTKAETLFSFWLQVELWKSVTGVVEKTKLVVLE